MFSLIHKDGKCPFSNATNDFSDLRVYFIMVRLVGVPAKFSIKTLNFNFLDHYVLDFILTDLCCFSPIAWQHNQWWRSLENPSASDFSCTGWSLHKVFRTGI